MKMKLSLLLTFALLGATFSANAASKVNMGGGKIGVPDEEFYSTMIWSAAGPFDRAQNRMFQLLADHIEEKTEGHIKVKVYHNAQLGPDNEIIENIQGGRIHGNVSTTAAIPYIVPAAAILDYPSLLTDMDIVTDMFWNTEFRERLNELYAERGLYLGAMVACKMRWLLCDRPVSSMDDFPAMQIRTGNNIYQMAYFEAIGCNVTPLDFSEVPVALQQGLVNGLENPLNVIQPGNSHELVHYLVNTQLSMYICNILLSKDYMESIPKKYKDLIDEALEAGSRESVELYNRMDQECREIMEREDTIFIELPDEMLAEMRARAVPVVEPMLRRDLGDELVDLLLSTYAEKAALHGKK